MMGPKLKEGLLWRAKLIIKEYGMTALINYRNSSGACGCMGPRDGEPYCGCRMWGLLEQHLLEIINEIDPDAALLLMRSRIVKALV